MKMLNHLKPLHHHLKTIYIFSTSQNINIQEWFPIDLFFPWQITCDHLYDFQVHSQQYRFIKKEFSRFFQRSGNLEAKVVYHTQPEQLIKALNNISLPTLNLLLITIENLQLLVTIRCQAVFWFCFYFMNFDSLILTHIL